MSETTFSRLPLPPKQLSNLESLGYLQMTAIQSQALPLALADKDLIAQAKTGSGKTATFTLPLLSKLKPRDFGTQALVLCPTRELASQVSAEIRRLARYQQNIKLVTRRPTNATVLRHIPGGHPGFERSISTRPGDIFGALTGAAGIAGKSVGKIEVMENAAYVAVERAIGDKALGRLLNGKIKGRKFEVRKL